MTTRDGNLKPSPPKPIGLRVGLGELRIHGWAWVGRQHVHQIRVYCTTYNTLDTASGNPNMCYLNIYLQILYSILYNIVIYKGIHPYKISTG